MLQKPKDQLLIIFGASGDLTYRKLIPSIFDLFMQNLLPENFAVLGVSRSKLEDETFRKKMSEGIKLFASFNQAKEEDINKFLKLIFYLSIDTDRAEDYALLKVRLQALDAEKNTGGNYIFYLSTPPALYNTIPGFLAGQGLNKFKKASRRIVIEKPFGVSLQSAIELNSILLEHFEEKQIYRIDHYLGKETVQNLLVTRFANSIYEPLWNRNFIQHIEVTATESIGVEGRGGYYDSSGALRDMLQNHLLQILALVAMEPPTEISAQAIRNEKLKVFQSLRPIQSEELFQNVIRGQYLASSVRGKYQKAYREEKDVDPQSRTETFIALKLFIDNWRWAGVPFYLRTGKQMPTRVSEIVIHFKPAPGHLFQSGKHPFNPENQLVLRIHPDEGILLKTGMKVPGGGYEVRDVNMDFHYKNLNAEYLPGAYERLLLDCMLGDPTLYTRGDALEDTWAFVQPILDFWKNNPEAPLYGYPSGTWGPEQAESLLKESGHSWRYPCKNLTDDGIYCEL